MSTVLRKKDTELFYVANTRNDRSCEGNLVAFKLRKDAPLQIRKQTKPHQAQSDESGRVIKRSKCKGKTVGFALSRWV
jgi:hypothetical protein